MALTQVRAQSLVSGFETSLVMDGWFSPVGATWDANGRMYVWEKSGRVWIVENGVRLATLEEIGAAPGYLVICTTGAAADASGCGPAANQLTRTAAFVLMSLGPNAADTPVRGSDESRNVRCACTPTAWSPAAAARARTAATNASGSWPGAASKANAVMPVATCAANQAGPTMTSPRSLL